VSSEVLSAPRFALTREAVEELSQRRHEPDWLLAARLRGLAALERLPVPDQRTEGWRRTNLRGLSMDAVDPIGELDTLTVAPDDSLARKAGASLFAYRNGVATREDSLAGARVMDLQDALQEPLLAQRIETHFGTVVAPDSDKFTALHYAFFNAGVVVFVPRGTVIEQPVWVSYRFDQAGHTALVHTLLIAEDVSQVSVVYIENMPGN